MHTSLTHGTERSGLGARAMLESHLTLTAGYEVSKRRHLSLEPDYVQGGTANRVDLSDQVDPRA